ncbi:MAG TPA: acyltransferase [Roseiarcus sp.]|nr:acyltransferase [Roseiarcus sp.]
MPGAVAAKTTSAAAYAQTSLAIANLRGVFILILVSFHAGLAYLGSTAGPAASFDQPPFLWLAFPIVDSRRFYGFDLYCAWEDVHVMALMFFLSGLFVPSSLQRKGALRFLADRVLRLGPPFLFSVLLLTPIALYPVFHGMNPQASVADYIAAYRSLPFLPNGPTWFLWLLLAVSIVAGLLYALAPAAVERLAWFAADARRRPQRFLAALTLAATLAYLPLALAFGPFDWFERGPVSFQLSRPLLYMVYFFAGAAVGVAGLGEGLLAPDGALAHNWRRLGALSALALFTWMGLTGVTLTYPDFAPLPMRGLSALAYVGASVAGVMLLIAVSTRFLARPIAWLKPLSRNALGIFVLHYAPLVWMQYLLLDAPMPAVLKALVVFAIVLPLSLALAAAICRLGWLARLIGEDAQPLRWRSAERREAV